MSGYEDGVFGVATCLAKGDQEPRLLSSCHLNGLDTLIWRSLRIMVYDSTILSLIKTISLVADCLNIMGARESYYLLVYGLPQTFFAPNSGLPPSWRFVVHHEESF